MEGSEISFRGWDEIARSVREALEAVAALGIRWRGTRFDHYLRVVEEEAALTRAELLAKPATTMTWEALRQADQLSEAADLFPHVSEEVLVEKLAIVFSGPDLHVDPERDDGPRNALFELMVGRIMWGYGFRVELTRDAEDLILNHDAMPSRISVECKRPAYCASVEEIERRMVRNLQALRRQLMRRDRGNVRMAVVAMDGLYRMRDHIAGGRDHETIKQSVRNALTEAVDGIRRINRERRLNLESGIDLGAVVLLGLGQDDEAAGFTLQITRVFTLARHPQLERAIAGILGLP